MAWPSPPGCRRRRSSRRDHLPAALVAVARRPAIEFRHCRRQSFAGADRDRQPVLGGASGRLQTGRRRRKGGCVVEVDHQFVAIGAEVRALGGVQQVAAATKGLLAAGGVAEGDEDAAGVLVQPVDRQPGRRRFDAKLTHPMRAYGIAGPAPERGTSSGGASGSGSSRRRNASSGAWRQYARPRKSRRAAAGTGDEG